MIFTTSCQQPAHEDDDYGQSSSGTEISSSGGTLANSSSSQGGDAVSGSFTDARDGKTYETVVIGTQTWMARNLNYNAEGSKCYGNDEANCNKYGRLYDGETANTVCPSGWHLPSNAEWSTLTDYVGDKKTAGTKLKADSGWVVDGNGTDDYGFAALPGGTGGGDDIFLNVGIEGTWWSATKILGRNGYYWLMSYDNKVIEAIGIGLFSVRCIQDEAIGGSISHGTPVTYETVVIGTQTWMARNLNYNAEGSKCYGDDLANCDKYGRLYDWITAKTVCPSGWHLPSDAEWTTLTDFAGGSSTAGNKLKATSGWNSNGNGTDTYGFSALPGGGGYSNGDFNNVGNNGYWWSSTEHFAYAYIRLMGRNAASVGRNGYGRTNLCSVRCAQD
jgi:uncharacterized protein (TIGR02145 family)